jgi:hypothetical protein
MDYNRNTKEFRMLDRFLPQVLSIHHTFEFLADDLSILSRNPLTRPQLHGKQKGKSNKLKQSIHSALVPGLARLACIASYGIMGMG